jgi:hypothetical protein
MTMAAKVKKAATSTKGKLFAVGALGTTALTAPTGAFAAEDLSSVSTSVSSQMGEIQTMAITILGSVAVVAIVLFGGIYGWRYGKKVFQTISK